MDLQAQLENEVRNWVQPEKVTSSMWGYSSIPQMHVFGLWEEWGMPTDKHISNISFRH